MCATIGRHVPRHAVSNAKMPRSSTGAAKGSPMGQQARTWSDPNVDGSSVSHSHSSSGGWNHTAPRELQSRVAARRAELVAGHLADTAATLSEDQSPMALRPLDPAALEEALKQVGGFKAAAFADSTLARDYGSNWQWWTRYCQQMGTPTVRVYHHSRATHDEAQREQLLWSLAVPWILARMSPGHHSVVPKPASAVQVIRGVRRVLTTMGMEPPPMAAINLVLKGLNRSYLDLHGPEALEVHRTEAIPHRWQVELVRLFRSSGRKLGQHTTQGGTSRTWVSLRALLCTLSQTGMRKAEVTSQTRAFTKADLARSNLTWVVRGVVTQDPTREQLLSLVPHRDYVMLKPPPSKPDPLGVVWGQLPIYLAYDPTKELNACAALRDLEVAHPCGGQDRRSTPLFADDSGRPFVGAPLDRVIKDAMQLLGAPKVYSWHSFRVALASSMLEAGATAAEIQAVCRWQTEESLRVYARLSMRRYTELLNNAYAVDFELIQPSNVPTISGSGYMSALMRMNIIE